VIHGNLNLDNIFLNDKMEVKIGNFTEFIEVSKNNEHEFKSYEVDIKSIGVIIYTLLIGEPPRSHNERILLPDELGISDGARDIIGEILNNDP
jgi:polo-like kinase 1